MRLNQLATMFLYPRGIAVFYLLFLAGLMLAASGSLVYMTGGTHHAYLHVFYVPIIMTGMAFGLSGGIVSALIASVIVGPYMPADVDIGVVQSTENWLIRSIFFLLIGALSGFGSSVLRSYFRELEQRYLTDTLTGLHNLSGLTRDFKRAHREGILKGPSIIYTLMSRMADIDRVIGPDGSQSLIREMAQRLSADLAPHASIAHIETGEFAILVYDGAHSERILETLRHNVGKTFTINDIPLFVELFYGLAQGSDHEGESLTSLVRKGKVAAAKAKKKGYEKASYDPADDLNNRRAVQIMHDLNHALNTNELVLHYQPKLHLMSGRVLGFEALVRWPHPTYGMVPPIEFVGITEQTLLIHPFTKWVVEQTFRQLKAWHNQNMPVSVSINLSMKNLQEPALIETFSRLSEEYSIPLPYIELEITESAISSNIAHAADVLRTLRQMGARIAVDDFGTGQASMNYLFELPMDVLKIDQVFIRSMLSNSAAEAIVRSAITLGHELGLEVVAEGIETEQEYNRIRELGCDLGQGYFFARPMAAAMATSWLQSKLAGQPTASTVASPTKP
ncbi:MAG: putative bifunctional diguanylate cyclase/phosphodiesterase [Holosporales bacterium]